MDNGKRFALRITALMLCLCAVSAALSSCGFFVDSYLEKNTEIALKTQEKTEKSAPDTTVEDIAGTTEWDDTTKTPETTKVPETTSAPETTKKPETTSAPETTLPPEQLDNIPDDVQHHVYLTYKNNGRCEELIGNVKVTVVMVSDDVSAWNDAALNQLSAALTEQEKDIEKLAAAYGKKLDMTFSYVGAKVTGDAAAGDYSDVWLDAAAKSVGFENLKTMQKDLDDKNSADSNPILFVLNKTGRAYAQYAAGTNSAEYLVVFSSDYSAFNHELYHVYGAQDFYYPAEVTELATTYLTDSIMQNGDVTDPLTAFIIGWDDEIDTEAYEFLKKTSHLTKEYLDAANEAQSVTGYVINHKLSYGTYTGNLERGVPTGEGTLTYESGDVAEGNFLGAKLEGQGSYTWASGDKYVGNFKNGEFDGYGVYTTPDGYKYEGNWSDGKRNGAGKATFTDGGIYDGNWVNNNRVGKGTYTWTNGDKYVGEFKDNKFDGQGVYTTPEGYKYDGAWKNSEREGYGVASWSDGSKYEGYWTAGKWNGQGKYKYTSGTVYEGSYVNGTREGQGTLTSPNGFSYTGAWVNDQYNGYGEAKYSDGGTYKGNFVDGQRQGQGTYVYPNGHKYVGEWNNGVRAGQGYMTWSDGSSYDGNWQDGKRHGYGKYINSQGKVFEGQWKNDVFQG